MNRPGPVGVAVVLAFAVVAVIEFRTVLGMVGVDVALRPYLAVATLLVAVGVLGLYALPEGNPSSAA